MEGDGGAMPAAAEDLMQMNETQASIGREKEVASSCVLNKEVAYCSTGGATEVMCCAPRSFVDSTGQPSPLFLNCHGEFFMHDWR